MATDIEARVARIIAATARIDADLLRDEVELEALGLDSIIVVEAMFVIEEAFDISLPLDMGPGALSFGHLCRQVAALVQARP